MKSHLFLLALIALLLSACESPAPPEAEVPDLNPPLDPTFFAPVQGQQWFFRQTARSLKPGKLEFLTEDDLTIQTVSRVQTYIGPKEIDGQTYHECTITHNGAPKPKLLLKYANDFLFVAAQSKPDGSYNLSTEPIPLAQKNMEVGSFWSWPPGTIGTEGFRTVSYEEVRLPAGVFQAYKVTFQGNLRNMTELKDYWFSPRYGIIREESRSYAGGTLRSQSVIELEKIVLPEPEKPSASDS